MAISTSTLATTPPTIDTIASCPRLMLPSNPKARPTTEAITANANDSTDDSASDALTFWPITVPPRNDTEKVPVWIAVESRLPMPPITLPRRPMAAGTRVRRVG